MRLKCIKLAGFKSFVDPTTVPFATNMTAIVGPNGCGKSNVIDAVRWVMGETSAKHLRGESMADVIFNGSSARKPLGQASIELVFDNSDASLGGEYARFAEISIKRKVTRDGVSDYFLNGVRCRRKDITDIFLGTGLGPRSYAIIEQGMISRLIEAKPDELRVYVEEAAGISRYKERRKDTEARIRRTRENLERLTDIRDELERRLERLKRQASAAEKYYELRTQERQLRGELRAVQWRNLDTELAEYGSRIGTLDLAREAVVTQQRHLDTQIEKQRVLQTELSEAHNQVQGRFYDLGSQIAVLERDIKHQQERQQQLNTELTQTRQSLGDTRHHLQSDEAKVAQWAEELTALEPQWQQARALEEASAQALAQAERAMQEWQQRWDAFSEQAAGPRRDADVQKSRIQHLEIGLQRLNQRSQQLKQEQGGLADDGLAEELEKQRSTLADVVTRAQSAQQLLDGVDGRLQARRQTVAEHGSALDTLRIRLQEARGRLASLQALQQAALADDDARITQWLQQQGLAQAPRLATVLDVQPGWEKAVETVLGRYLEAVCVEGLPGHLGDSLQGFEGRLALLDSTQPAAVAAAPGSLLEKVGQAGSLASLLARVRVAESLPQALAARESLSDEQSWITPEGAWVGRGWLVLNPADEAQHGVIARAREIETLGSALATDQAEAQRLETALAEARDALRAIEAERSSTEQSLRQLARERGDAQAAASSCEARLEALGRRRESLGRQLSDMDAQYRHEESELVAARQQLQLALDSMSRNEEQRQALQSERDSLRQALDDSRQTARQNREAYHQLTMQRQTLQTQRSAAATGIERLRTTLVSLEQQQQRLEENLAGSDSPLQALHQQLEVLLQQRLGVENELTAARQALHQADHDLRALEGERHTLEQDVQKRQRELEQLRLEAQTQQVRRSTLEEQLREDEQDLPALLAALPADISEAQWQLDLQQVTNRIQNLGAINLTAIDEYRTDQERKSYLDAQNDDLVEALDTLENAIRKIDRETRSRFQETFDRINEGLQDLFPKVFGGGKACLEMTGDDLLDTGVAIMARPPGKTNASIHILSGGEKALTAIALVFSIFQLNPAPFCMLDEVDAPLDDINTGRYARMVHEMSSKVQFIYITHNKISMEVADQLMGVTMQEPGVSRIVSVDVDQAADLATA